MLSLDEAIAHAREVAKSNKTKATYDDKFLKRFCTSKKACIKCAEEHEQIAEWLEELKEYKKKPEGWMWDEAERKGYNKAIYDFTRILHHEEFDNAYGLNIVLTPQQVDEIAEQLKVGGENETVL